MPSVIFDNYDCISDAGFYFVYIIDGVKEPIYSGQTTNIDKCKKYKNLKLVKIAILKELTKYLK